jgi:hypothetical protein
MAEVIIAGPDGRLEGRYHKQEGRDDAPIALILHPEPAEGGTMNNKVAYTLFQSFVDLGFSVLRFNFRGVGNSQGTSDDGTGELADATAALDWLQMDNKNTKVCWVAGYSFGAWIGMQLLMRRPEINGFVSLAIPANTKDFSFLAPCPTSGLIIHGSKDTKIPEEAVDVLTEKLSHQRNISIDYRVFPDADHDFTGHLKGIYQAILDHVTEAMKKKPKKIGKRSSRSARVLAALNGEE